MSFIILGLSCKKQTQRNNKKSTSSTLIEEALSQLKSVSQLDSLNNLASLNDKKLQQLFSDSIIAEYRKEVGMFLYRRSHFEMARHYFELSENSFRNADMLLEAMQMLANQAVLQELKGNYKEAAKIYISAVEFFKQKGDSTSWASALSNIGVVYEEMGMADKAICYDKKSLVIKLAMHDTLGSATNYNNIGVAFSELLNDPDSAIYYYTKAFDIYKSYGHQFRCAQVRNNLGMLYTMLDRFDLAEHHLNKAYTVLDSVNNLLGKAISQRYFGELYFKQGNESKALIYFYSAMETFKTIDDKKSLMEMGSLLSKVYISMGRYVEATQMMQFRNELKDSLMNIENKSIIADMETKYQVKEKNKTIEVLKLEEELQGKKIKNQAVIIASLLIIFMLVVIIYYFNINKNKLKHKQLRLELHNYLLRIGELQTEIYEKGNCAKFSEEKIKEFDLSDRETEVLKLIAQGYKNLEIAEKLFVSQNTIKSHIKNIYIKLDVKNRIEALKKVDIV